MSLCPRVVVPYTEADNGWTIVMYEGLGKLEDQGVLWIQRDVHLGAQNEILLCIVLRDPVNGCSATKGVAGIKRGPNVVGQRVAEMSFDGG